jgi:uncharacterized protein YjiS (DUF1127 family)
MIGVRQGPRMTQKDGKMMKRLSISPSAVMNLSAIARSSRREPGWQSRLSEIAALWLHRSRSRRVLATLDDRQLSDLGLTAVEATRESAKPFWRA